MDRVAFVQLVRDLVEAMGQHLEAARPIPEGLALRTSDRYLYVFVDDVDRGSAVAVHRWCEEGDVPRERLFVFSVLPVPASWGPEVQRGGGTVISGTDFRRLVDELGIESPLVEKDPNIHRAVGSALPSARELDADMIRAQSWFSAGVMPLAVRFFEEAVQLKPEFLGGWAGLARSQAAVENWEAAEHAWGRVLALDSGSLDALWGLAAAAKGCGNIEREVAAYRALLDTHPTLTAARAELVAALIEERAWASAREEIGLLLRSVPSDPRLHFLLALVIERTDGPTDVASAERSAARRLGLTEEAERELARSLAPADEPRGPSPHGQAL